MFPYICRCKIWSVFFCSTLHLNFLNCEFNCKSSIYSNCQDNHQRNLWNVSSRIGSIHTLWHKPKRHFFLSTKNIILPFMWWVSIIICCIPVVNNIRFLNICKCAMLKEIKIWIELSQHQSWLHFDKN